MRSRSISLLVAAMLMMAACGGDSASVEAFCDIDARLEATGQFLDLPPDEARETIPRVRAIFEDGLSAAPDDVKPSYEILVNAFVPILDVFEDSDFGAGEVDGEALSAAFAAFSAPEVSDASDVVEAWVDANCGA